MNRITFPGRRPPTRLYRALLAGVALSALLVGCSELFTDPAPPLPAGMAISFSTASGAGAAASAAVGEAFDKANRVAIRIEGNGSVLLDDERSFAPAPETRVTVSLGDMQDPTAILVTVSLLAGGEALFAGSGQAVVIPGEVTQVPIHLVPVPASIQIEPVPELTSIGQAVVAQASARFATGDELPGVLIGWSGGDPAVAVVDAAGTITARGEGVTEIRAGHGAVTAAVEVRVRQVPVRVVVTPPQVIIGVDASVALVADVRDAGNHAIARAPTWTSSAVGVAGVSAAGVVTGVAPGMATITAQLDGVSGQAAVEVRRIARIVASPAEPVFRMMVGGADPAPLVLAVTNEAAGPLNHLALGSVQYGAGASGWLSASLSSGSAPAQLTLSASGAALPPGTYSAVIPILSPAAVNTAYDVAVTLVVETAPHLVVAPAAVTFHAAVAGPDPAGRDLSVTNAGGGAITDLVLGAIEYGPGAAGWLAAGLSGSTAPATLSLAAATQALPAGTYSAVVPVRSADAQQESAVAVTVIVAPAAVISASPSRANLTAYVGSESGPRNVAITNVGAGELRNLAVAGIQYPGGSGDWLSASLSGTTAPANLTLNAQVGGLEVGFHTASVFLVSPDAANSPFEVEVVLEVMDYPLIELATPSVTLVSEGYYGVDPFPVRHVAITNAGGGSLRELHLGEIEYGSSPGGWLAAYLDGGDTAPTSLVVTLAHADLLLGVHTAVVPVLSDFAENSPEYLEVTLILATWPEMQVGEPVDVTGTSATINATITSNAPTAEAWVEWGTNPGSLTATPRQTIGLSGDPHALSFPLTGLEPGTLYYFQVVAENVIGERRSEIYEFLTLLPSPTSMWLAEGNYNDGAGPNDGSPVGTVSFSPNGFLGSAFRFDGEWEPGEIIAGGAGIDSLGQFTLSAWVNIAEAAGEDRVLRFVSLGNEKAVLRMDGFYAAYGALPNSLHFYVFSEQGGGGIRSAPLLTMRECYYHVAGTFDGEVLRLYLDGELVGTANSGPAIVGDGVSLSGDNIESMHGLLDEVRVYDRALSAAAIQSLFMQSGSGLKCSMQS